MLEPEDAPISTADAKAIYKNWMLRIGRLDKQEVGLHVGYFAEAMQEHEEELKGQALDAKQSLSFDTEEYRAAVKAAKQALSRCKDESKIPELQTELQEAEEFLARSAQPGEALIKTVQEHIKAFKADKRAFLVEYINNETQTAE